MKLITIMKGKCNPVKIIDLRAFGLPESYRTAISQIIYDNRMYYEPWAETADSFQDLKNKLRMRGHRNLPMTCKPMWIPTHGAKHVNVSKSLQKRTMMQAQKLPTNK